MSIPSDIAESLRAIEDHIGELANELEQFQDDPDQEWLENAMQSCHEGQDGFSSIGKRLGQIFTEAGYELPPF